jgi:hypothetical protein
MKYIRLAVMMLAVTQILFACAGFPGSKRAEQEIIYKLKNGNLVNVFNIKKSWYSSESISYLSRRDLKYGEWGGQMEICSDKDYFCIAGGINIAFPKNINEKNQWHFYERDCAVEKTFPEQDITIIMCKFKKYWTRFTYTPTQGITSYVRSPDPSEEYELIGDKGLFAQTEEKSNVQTE